ncbi:MAG: family 16 glycoside hydrolase [Planctomycetota bacterium]|nr:family 16 glycoside hydrolase [Planctomycetota bacterium]
MHKTLTFVAVACLTAAAASAQLPSGWKAHDLSRPAPKVVTPAPVAKPAVAPSDAIILFDGTDLSQWRSGNGKPARWKVVNGAMESVAGSGPVVSKQEFSDCQLHLEFATPAKVKGQGQGRGNSGVFLMGEIEVQVLDSYENLTYADGSAGAIYGQYPPLVNASRQPGEWQTYDIVFRSPRFDGQGKLTEPARLTVLHNGVLIQDASEVYGPTSWIQHRPYSKGKTKGPISLQDHGNPVRYRNVWVRSLAKSRPLPAGEMPEPVEISAESATRLVGTYGDLRVSSQGKRLYLHFAGAALEMVPVSETEFLFAKSAGKVVFKVDQQGKGTRLELKLDAAGTRKGVATGK